MSHELSQEEIEAMRTPENWMNYVAQQLRDSIETRRTIAEALVRSEERQDERTRRIETELKQNTEDTAALRRDTKEILEVVTALKGGRTVLGWAGKVFVWLGGLAAAWVAISALMHSEVKFPWQ